MNTKIFTDARGNLLPINLRDLPFECKRVFYTFDVPNGMTRGKHASKTSDQLIVCLGGVLEISLNKGSPVNLFPGDNIFVPKMTWNEITFWRGAALTSFCSKEYNKEDYIENYEESCVQVFEAIDGNSKLASLIDYGESFACGKIGFTEAEVLKALFIKNFSHVRGAASINAGITPPNDETLLFFCTNYIAALKNIDLLGSMEARQEELILDAINAAPPIYQARFLEPFYFKEPWSASLKDKSVLVIHPFEDSIKKQYAAKDKLFSNRNILPDFNLLTLKAAQTNGGGLPDSKNFHDSLIEMIDMIFNIKFDIALIGCGAYSLLLANFIKSIGKQAISIGGGLQILFGIKGKRWDSHEDISKLFNDSWIRPSLSERTTHFNTVEGGTYW